MMHGSLDLEGQDPLQVSGLWENQNSNLAYLQLLLPRVVNLLMRILLNRTTENYFGSSDSGKIKSQTSSSFNLFYPEAMDLLTNGPVDG
jgi:hypothetical protein